MLKNTLILAAAMAALSSQATLIVNEPFKIGTDRSLNQYSGGELRTFSVLTADSGLAPTTGTASAPVRPWQGGTNNYFIPVSSGTPLPGLTDADVSYEQGTAVRWGGTAGDTGFLRAVGRQLVPGYTTASTYYFSIMMKRESWINPVIAGNTVIHDDSLAGFTSAATGGGLKGFMVGYQSGRGAGGTGEFPSLVIKAGNINIDPTTPPTTVADGLGLPATADQNLVVSGADSTFARTYTFVVKMDVNLSGPETFTYWVDDDVTTTNWGNELLATASARYKGTFTAEAMTSLTDINRVLMASPSSSGGANYDEFRMATSLESVTGVPNVLIPEPSAMGLLALAVPALRRRRA